jgi:hypothetical protein
MKLPRTVVRTPELRAPTTIPLPATKNRRDGDAPPVNTNVVALPIDNPTDARNTKKSDAVPFSVTTTLLEN